MMTEMEKSFNIRCEGVKTASDAAWKSKENEDAREQRNNTPKNSSEYVRIREERDFEKTPSASARENLNCCRSL